MAAKGFEKTKHGGQGATETALTVNRCKPPSTTVGFVAEVHADFIEKLRADELDTEQKRKKLLDACAEELLSKYPEWQNL